VIRVAGIRPPLFLTMSSSLQITSVHLRVANLARSVDFYTRQLGFVAQEISANRASLSVAGNSAPLLALVSEPSARPAEPDSAGLFHAACLLPSCAALGAWLQHAMKSRVEFDGGSDHGVSEALYLSDPDGNGLEFYCDRPRHAWPFAATGELAMITAQLDVPSLLLDSAKHLATPLDGAHWGHLHFRVTDLDRSEAFYRHSLGLTVTQRSLPGARFLAAGGYHHHVGLNTWGRPRLPHSATASGLIEATFSIPDIVEPQTLTDPDGITLRVTASQEF
jgi:catechol 2,3-dioxygenase